MKKIITELRVAITVAVGLAVIVCGIYPVVVWGLGSILFPHEAGGSLIGNRGKVVGSSLIAQGFTAERYFHPRPSAAGAGYDGTASGGSNLGPLSKKLVDTVGRRLADYRKINHLAPDTVVPADAVTASGSGLDPHISVANALLQAPRVARARGLRAEEIRRKIDHNTDARSLGFLGEPGVNVLKLNLDLDGLAVRH